MEQVVDQQTLTNIIYVAIFLIGALLFGIRSHHYCQTPQPFLPYPKH